MTNEELIENVARAICPETFREGAAEDYGQDVVSAGQENARRSARAALAVIVAAGWGPRGGDGEDQK